MTFCNREPVTSTATERVPFVEHCPECVGTRNLPPLWLTLLPNAGAECLYRCPECRFAWRTWWSTLGEDPKFLVEGRR